MFDRSILCFGQKMADGRPLFCALLSILYSALDDALCLYVRSLYSLYVYKELNLPAIHLRLNCIDIIQGIVGQYCMLLKYVTVKQLKSQ